MQIKQIKFFVFALCYFSFFYWGWQRWCVEAPVTHASAPLIVGTNVGYPPFILRDENGAVTGFDHDVAVAIAERLGRPILFHDMSFDALLLSLEQGSVDMIIGGISITQARKKKGVLIPYYGTNVDRLSLVYRTGHVPQGLQLNDAVQRGLRVCTQAGTSLEEVLEQYDGMRLVTLGEISDIYLEVDHKNCDLAVLDCDTARSMVQSSDRLASHEVTIPPSQRIEGFGVGVTKENSILREQVVHAILELQQQNVIERFAQQWFKQG